MLLLINNPSSLSPAEERLAEWITWSPAQPGVALLNIQVPDRGSSRQLDALIWSPQRCVAVEVKGFRTRQDGALVVPPNGPWLMDDGRTADIYGNDDTHDPTSQVRDSTMAAKHWVEKATGLRSLIHGLVLVMLLPDQDVPSLDAPQRPPKTDIIIEDFDVFRYYFHRISHEEPAWTSTRIARVVDSLGLAHLYGGHPDALAAALGETTGPNRTSIRHELVPLHRLSRRTLAGNGRAQGLDPPVEHAVPLGRVQAGTAAELIAEQRLHRHGLVQCGHHQLDRLAGRRCSPGLRAHLARVVVQPVHHLSE
ncbi:nuclease-related domain-containing protein [Nocardia sp. BMG51109]|uniref:nuclease-related domain-containing protein n=1 Tax=Nocardia sp. BMG51109 TaxID=1056816 RepID=UPI0004B2A27F|nr:nuclease-related domain-containing protein [Nocardia sp. BMG51109]